MCLPQTQMTLGKIPEKLRLSRGQSLTCNGGCVWITSDALAGLGRDSDVLLENGQSFVVPKAATYIVDAPFDWGLMSILSPHILG